MFCKIVNITFTCRKARVGFGIEDMPKVCFLSSWAMSMRSVKSNRLSTPYTM